MKDRFKRSVAGLVALASVLSFAPAIAPVASAATDICVANNVASTSDLCKAMQYLNSRGIMTSFGTGYFNRAESLAVGLRALDAGFITAANTSVTGQQLGFSDTPPGTTQWWYSYVLRGKLLGAIKGYADGTFRAGNYVTRAEFVKMFLGLSGSNGIISRFNVSDPSAGGQYLTGDIYALRDQWFAQYFAFVKSGYPMENAFHDSACSGNVNFCPDLYITRNEAAIFMYYYVLYMKSDYVQYSNTDLLNFNTEFNQPTTPAPTPNTTLTAPVLYSPANGTNLSIANPNILFQFYPSTAASYQVGVMTPGSSTYQWNGFAAPSSNGTDAVDILSNSLINSNGTYYWVVRAWSGANGTGSYVDSSPWTFYVTENSTPTPTLTAPVLYSPSDPSYSNPLLSSTVSSVTFSWSSVPNATSYEMVVSNSIGTYDFSSGSATQLQVQMSSLKPIVGKTNYDWHVIAHGNNGASATSSTNHFSYLTSTLGTPTLSSPANGTNYYNNTPVNFNWNAAANATHYDFVIAWSGSYPGGSLSNTGTTYKLGNVTSYSLPASIFPKLAKSGDHFTAVWFIRAYDANGNYADSLNGTFYNSVNT